MTQPIYDSRKDGRQFIIKTDVDLSDDPIYRAVEELDDPFVRQIVKVRFCFWDRVRVLFGAKTDVTIRLDASKPVQEAVLELDDNYRGMPGSARHRECEQDMQRALSRFASGLPDDREGFPKPRLLGVPHDHE